jgi:hypothetical protein
METRYHNHHIIPPHVDRPEARIPSDLDEYLFDLQGFCIIRGALSKAEVDEANAAIDRIPRSIPRNGWFGRVHREDHPEHRGISYQQVYELGGTFEKMIDHPNYINYMMRFVGGHETFDRNAGPIFVDENFFSIRGPGEAIPLHSGGHTRCMRTIYGYHNGRFHCGQVNILFAFNDIGPGDGATMVIPGSHKSNIIHPEFTSTKRKTVWTDEGGSGVEGTPGAVEVHLKAGDAIVFVDATCHGSATRVNPGERRIAVYRYGSAWNRTRWGYEPSEELLNRLNPFARSVVSTGKRFVPTA